MNYFWHIYNASCCQLLQYRQICVSGVNLLSTYLIHLLIIDQCDMYCDYQILLHLCEQFADNFYISYFIVHHFVNVFDRFTHYSSLLCYVICRLMLMNFYWNCTYSIFNSKAQFLIYFCYLSTNRIYSLHLFSQKWLLRYIIVLLIKILLYYYYYY